MAKQNKRYYWLKLYEDFFTSKRIKRLRQIAGGDCFTIIYFKMLLKALKTEGYLYFDGVVDDFAEELAIDLDESPDNVRLTMDYLIKVGLLELSEDGSECYLTYLQNCIGSETASTQRSRISRENKKKALQCNTDATKALQCNTDASPLQQSCNVEIDKEIEIDDDVESTSIEINPSPELCQSIIDEWNTLSEYGINELRILGPRTARGEALLKQLNQFGRWSFSKCIDNIKKSDYLLGKTPHRKTPIDFNWLIDGDNYAYVLEGRYTTYDGSLKQSIKVRNFVGLENNENISELEAKLLDN